MIIDGKFVKYSEHDAALIQSTLNKMPGMGADVKSEINPREVESAADGAGLAFQDSKFFENGDKRQNDSPWFVLDRRTGYGYYVEMDQMEFIHRALEIIADDSCQQNTDGNVLKVYSDDEAIQSSLEDLFVERLDFNSNLWSIVFDTARLGDNFYEVIPDNYDNPKKIIYLRYLEPYKVNRIEKNNRLSHFEFRTYEDRNEKQELSRTLNTQSKNESTEKIYNLQPWQVVHFKVNEDKTLAPYGASLLRSGFATYKKLVMLEDCILVYRISRAPERRVFYIDVGNMNVADSKRFMQKIKASYRTTNVMDETGGLNHRANVLSITSDIFVPVREGGVGTKIETLQGGTALTEIKDLEYFKDKILKTMNIPPAYLGDTSDRSRGSLSQLDIKFSRFIERVQLQILRGIYKIASIELFFNGYKKDDLKNYTIEMTPPSNIKEITDIELMNQKVGLISQIQALNIFSNEWVLKEILGLSTKEINNILFQKKIETSNSGVAGQEMGGMGGMPMGGTDMGMGTNPMEPGMEQQPGQQPGVGMEQPISQPGDISASTIMDYFGKDFITESKDKKEQFIQILKYIKEEGKKEIPTFCKNISKVLNESIVVEKKIPKNAITEQIITGELKGLNWGTEDEVRSFKVFSKEDINEEVIIII